MFKIGQTVTRNGRYYRITRRFASATDIHNGWEIDIEEGAGYTRCRHPGSEARVTCAVCGRTLPVSKMYAFRPMSDEEQPPPTPAGLLTDPTIRWKCRDDAACAVAAAPNTAA